MKPTSLNDSARLRPLLLGVFLLGTMGTGVELLLLGHYENPWQWTPLAMLTLGLAIPTMRFFVEGRRLLEVFRATMVLFVASGCLGIILHYRNNEAFELEMYPEMEGTELIWESLTGAMPALAPGTMIQLGLLGLLYTFRHPVLTTRVEPDRDAKGES